MLARTTRTAHAAAPSSVIKHVIVNCSENRSLDHYFGYAPWIGAYGPPAGYSQPNGKKKVTPFHFATLTPPDIGHSWSATHGEWDKGRMDGFYRTDGINCMGYFTEADLPYYYSLFNDFTLCVNYFCSVLGPTFPNRLYLAGGTSGGNTSNDIAEGRLTYPIILDLLDAYGITWKVYSLGAASISAGGNNHFQLFAGWYSDPRVSDYTTDDYLDDLATGDLPQVSFIVNTDDLCEHPPANIQVGMSLVQQLVEALQASSYWSSSVFLHTYDEGGGYFDHVAPPVFDAYGAGIRVPMWVISPHANPANLQTTLYEHSSVLKFIEAVYALPTLASINHRFDTCTPKTNNEAAKGHRTGPPAPPRDSLASIGNLTECLTAF